jgi:hypothetical protein
MDQELMDRIVDMIGVMGPALEEKWATVTNIIEQIEKIYSKCDERMWEHESSTLRDVTLQTFITEVFTTHENIL